MIEISERVEVPAAPRIVWDVLSDPRAVVDCMPGAKLGERLEDGSYDATVTVRFGPAKVTFRAKVALELDGTAMIGHVSSRGRDDQGGTRVKPTMTFKVVAGQTPGGHGRKDCSPNLTFFRRTSQTTLASEDMGRFLETKGGIEHGF